MEKNFVEDPMLEQETAPEEVHDFKRSPHWSGSLLEGLQPP